jgi:apolipoprotein N-acyltransferase
LSRASSPVSRAAAWTGGLTGVKRACVAVLLGAVSVLAFAPVHVWPILFVSFGGLVWLLDGCHGSRAALGDRLKCAGLTGFWFGFGFFVSGLYWVAEAFLIEPWRHGWLIPFVMTALPAGMALFFAAACVLAMGLWRPGPARVFALAIAFGLAEYARGHVLTGLPWNLIGYGLLTNGPLMQLAALFGVYALSLVAVLLFAAPAAIWNANGRSRGAALLAGILFVLLGLGYVWGERRLASAPEGTTDVRLRIVQANVDQADKWRPENSAEIFAEYLDLTRTEGLDEMDLVIWPETALPFLLGDSPDALAAIGEALPQDTTLLVGVARVVDQRDPGGRLEGRAVFNSLLAVGNGGQILDSYDKMHLVPFGEYLPFQDFLEGLGFMQMTGVRGGFSEGTGPRLLDIRGLPPVWPLICYEIIFPDEIADQGTRAGWMLNVTNDAWFGSSAGPYQHFHQAQVRAVEQGLPVVRAANTGISAVIDPWGRVLAEIGLGEKGLIDANLPKVGPITTYVALGMKLEILVLMLGIFGWLVCRSARIGANLTGSYTTPMNQTGLGTHHQDADQPPLFTN